MNEIKLKKTTIIARQILLSFIDINKEALTMCDIKRFYKVPFKAYDEFRYEDKIRFKRELHRLKQHGLIEIYIENKEKKVELTKTGQEKLKKYLIDDLAIQAPSAWDGKWRMVVFDIPNTKRKIRDYLRHKLVSMGFVELQESIYVHPFDCLNEINLIQSNFFIKPYVQFIVADRIETELDLIKIFLNCGVLKESQLKK